MHSILLALGARDDLAVKVDNCSDFLLEDDFGRSWEGDLRRQRDPYGRRDPLGQRDPFRQRSGQSVWPDPYDRLQQRDPDREQRARVRIRAFMPVEVTPDVLVEIQRDKSRRELVSRVTGDPAAKLNDPILFPAHWQPISLSKDSLGLKPEECELLNQMSNDVFEELGLRHVGKRRKCNRSDISRGNPALTVEALVSAPIGATSLPQMPAGEAESGSSEPSASE